MTKPTPPPLPRIELGRVAIVQSADGAVLVQHNDLREAVVINAAQLQRWLMRQVRERFV